MVAESFAGFTLWITSCKHLPGQHLIVNWHSTVRLYSVLWWRRRYRSHAVRWHLVRYRWRYGFHQWQVAYVPTNWRITDICSRVVILSDLLGLVHLVDHSEDTVDLTLDLVEVWHNLTSNDLSYQVHSSLVYDHTILVLLQHWLRRGGVLWEYLLYTWPWSSLLSMRVVVSYESLLCHRSTVVLQLLLVILWPVDVWVHIKLVKITSRICFYLDRAAYLWI